MNINKKYIYKAEVIIITGENFTSNEIFYFSGPNSSNKWIIHHFHNINELTVATCLKFK